MCILERQFYHLCGHTIQQLRICKNQAKYKAPCTKGGSATNYNRKAQCSFCNMRAKNSSIRKLRSQGLRCLPDIEPLNEKQLEEQREKWNGLAQEWRQQRSADEREKWLANINDPNYQAAPPPPPAQTQDYWAYMSLNQMAQQQQKKKNLTLLILSKKDHPADLPELALEVKDLPSEEHTCRYCWCRFDGSDGDVCLEPRKLPCGHVYGVACLRRQFMTVVKPNQDVNAALVNQPKCATCRRDYRIEWEPESCSTEEMTADEFEAIVVALLE